MRVIETLVRIYVFILKTAKSRVLASVVMIRCFKPHKYQNPEHVT